MNLLEKILEEGRIEKEAEKKYSDELDAMSSEELDQMVRDLIEEPSITPKHFDSLTVETLPVTTMRLNASPIKVFGE